jgi:hypothetical protein
MFLHPNPISKQRSARKRRTGVDRQYPHPLAARTERSDKRGGSGRLADPRRAGEAEDMRSSGIRREFLHDHRQCR